MRATAARSDEADWAKTGLAELTRPLAGERDAQKAAQALVSALAPYVGAQHAVYYVAEGDFGHTGVQGAAEPLLRLAASYAYRERKHLAASFRAGEGLVGQCALERQRILLRQAPPDYIRITSGLGEAAPLDVVVLPVVNESRLLGVLELASLARYSEVQLAFLDQLAENLGVLFRAIAAAAEVNAALAHSEELARDLQVNEEELKTSNEELQEQTRRLEENQQVLEEKQQALEAERVITDNKNRELEAMQATLEERAEQLTVSGKYKSEFLANMSHELRTPLNSLLLLSQMLAENKDANLNPRQLEYVRTIHDSGADLLHLINEILDLSKIESGRLEISADPVVLADLTTFAESQFRALADNRGLTLDINLADGLPEALTTDEMRLEQVLRNLLSNALKFTEKGGVSFRITRAAAGTRFERASLREAAAVLAFTVADSGIGIGPEKQALIWEAFQQAEGGIAREYGGTGLGLTISREIARLLGGEIQLHSTLGEGSTFTLYLPDSGVSNAPGQVSAPRAAVALAAPPLARQGVTQETRQGVTQDARQGVTQDARQDDRALLETRSASERVALIIEDDARFAGVLQQIAKEHSFRTLVSATGGEGLELARRYHPDCILLDLGLPDLDGEEVLRAVLADPQLRRIPVEVISGHERGRALLDKGAFAFLLKPVSPDALEESFRRIELYLHAGPKHILIVEDEPYARNALAQLVSAGDVAVRAVRDAAAALATLGRGRFDAMILDLHLPDMDGRELLRRAREELGLVGLPVIIYTAQELSSEEERELLKQTRAIVIKGEAAPQRLLDELALFLHGVKERLPEQKRQQIRQITDPASPLQRRLVLVVDDDIRNLFSLTAVLEEQGLNVCTAENGEAALARLDAEPGIELVLMDIMMPKMDGYEATRRLRADARWKKLPVIALTAKAMKGDREKCLEAGASDYLAKPVDAAKLLNLVRVWLHP